MVKQQRQLHPQMGCRKLKEVMAGDLEEAGVRIGRDRLFEVLRNKAMLVPPPTRSCRTTNSRHCLPLFGNLARDLELTGPNQLLVSDVTYLRTEEDFVYLALIMDRYSRKIVGYHCGDTLETKECMVALDQAVAQLPQGHQAIHHSDRGCQYCCHEYVGRLQEGGLRVSMTETDHCAENSHAERLNGTLKREYGLHAVFRNAEQARRAVDQAVWLYNELRPHLSLDMRTPGAVHKEAV